MTCRQVLSDAQYCKPNWERRVSSLGRATTQRAYINKRLAGEGALRSIEGSDRPGRSSSYVGSGLAFRLSVNTGLRPLCRSTHRLDTAPICWRKGGHPEAQMSISD